MHPHNHDDLDHDEEEDGPENLWSESEFMHPPADLGGGLRRSISERGDGMHDGIEDPDEGDLGG